MPENIGSSSAPYNTRIPKIVENADIQTALRLYHYGANTSNPETIISESIAGHLNELENTKVDKVPDIIAASVNLDSIVATGFYVQPSVTNARNGTNYPTIANLAYPGMLRVVNSGTLIFQEYHLIGETGNVINTVFWRVQFLGSWSAWKGLVDSTDIINITDNFYHRQSATYTRTEMDNRYSPRLFVETTPRTSNTSLILEDINRIVVMNVADGGTLTIPTEASVPFPLGSVVNVYNISSNLLTISGASGVTLRNGGRLEPFKEASLRKRATDEWVAAGPLY